MFRHVLLMHEFEVLDSRQIAFPVVANHASFARHLTLSAYHVAMTVYAVHAFFIGQIMREFDIPAQIEFLGGNLVAVGASRQVLVEGHILEVAKVARRKRHGHVLLALDDLAVATGAAQLYSAPRFAQMRGMVEVDPAVYLPARQKTRFVAAGTQATGVGDLRCRAGAFAAGNILGQLHQPQHFSPQFAPETRGKVTFDAGHVLVLRCLPGIVIRFHYVAASAKIRPRCIKPGAKNQYQHKEKKRREQGQEPQKELTDLPPDFRHSFAHLSQCNAEF
jgi:hypothetical protein